MTTRSGPSVAVLNGRRFPEATACVHCRAPVREINYALGDRLMHYDPDASFNDNIWRHCRLTVATAVVCHHEFWNCRTDGTTYCRACGADTTDMEGMGG